MDNIGAILRVELDLPECLKQWTPDNGVGFRGALCKVLWYCMQKEKQLSIVLVDTILKSKRGLKSSALSAQNTGLFFIFVSGIILNVFSATDVSLLAPAIGVPLTNPLPESQ
jgi:hypothetical protein